MRGIKTHEVTIGDSLQKLARMYSIQDWREIAEINELQPPYIDSVFGSNLYTDNKYVACIGDVIVIPSQNSLTVSDTSDREELEMEAYGSDLNLYHYEPVDHIVKGTVKEEGRDLELVKGIGNLSQQLMSRLSVKKGALLLHPEYGSNLYKYEGNFQSQEIANKIKYEVESCLRSDFRVLDVKDIKVQLIHGATFVTAKIYPIEPNKSFDFKYLLKE